MKIIRCNMNSLLHSTLNILHDLSECKEAVFPITTQAEVTDNNDPDGKGRIRMKFTQYENNDNEKMWIPCLTPFVGKDRGGFVMIPDVGDSVVVHIVGGQPYVVGSLRKEKLPDNCSDVTVKSIAVDSTIVAMDSKQIRDVFAVDDVNIRRSVQRPDPLRQSA